MCGGYGNPYVLTPVPVVFPGCVVPVVPVGIYRRYCPSCLFFPTYKKRKNYKCRECPSHGCRNVLIYITTRPLHGAYVVYGLYGIGGIERQVLE